MIHTIELSKMISADMFNEIINSLNIPYNRQTVSRRHLLRSTQNKS